LTDSNRTKLFTERRKAKTTDDKLIEMKEETNLDMKVVSQRKRVKNKSKDKM
jgi:hypothetical protein